MGLHIVKRKHEVGVCTKNINKKRKILLGTLIPISIGAVALSCGLGFGLGCKPIISQIMFFDLRVGDDLFNKFLLLPATPWKITTVNQDFNIDVLSFNYHDITSQLNFNYDKSSSNFFMQLTLEDNTSKKICGYVNDEWSWNLDFGDIQKNKKNDYYYVKLTKYNTSLDNLLIVKTDFSNTKWDQEIFCNYFLSECKITNKI